MLTTLLAPPVIAAVGLGLLWAILGISFLIFIHEYGHYTACRLTGTRVETFSVGFGPRLFGWERPKGGRRRFTVGRRQLDAADHAMDFRVALIPLGGYVKMAGENPGEERSGAPDEFSSKTIPQRLFIVSAGVINNAITALVFYALCFGGGLEKEPPVLGTVLHGSPAWEAGLEPGDHLVSIAGHTLESFMDVRVESAFLSREEARPIEVVRDGRPLTLRARARYNTEQGIVKLGVGPASRLTVGEGAEAFEIGFDERVTVDGRPAVGGEQAYHRILQALASGKPEVEVRAGGRAHSVKVDPPAPGAEAPKSWRLGIAAAGPVEVEGARGRAAGLAKGDVLLTAFAGERRVPLADVRDFAALAETLEAVDAFEVRRAGEVRKVAVSDASDRDGVVALLADIALAPLPPIVAPVPAGGLSIALTGPYLLRQPASPAEGVLAPGTRLLAVGTQEVTTFEQIAVLLAERDSGDPITLKIAGPDGAASEVRLTPAALEPAGSVALVRTPHKEPLQGGGFFGSLGHGANRLWRETVNTFRTIGGFFNGNIAFTKNIAGPITLVSASSHASQQSFLDLLWFLAYVSVMLAVLNVLPIPVLDGGHVVFLIAEKLRGGRPLSDATIGRFQLVGMLLLLLLMFFAIKNDILLNFF